MSGIPIPAEAALGPALRSYYFDGIIVHSKGVVGEGCARYHGVTLEAWKGGVGLHALGITSSLSMPAFHGN